MGKDAMGTQVSHHYYKGAAEAHRREGFTIIDA